MTDKNARPGEVAVNCLPATRLGECGHEPGGLPAIADKPSEVKVIPPAAVAAKQDLTKAPVSEGSTPVVLPIPPAVMPGTKEPGSPGAEIQKKAPDVRWILAGRPEVVTGARKCGSIG